MAKKAATTETIEIKAFNTRILPVRIEGTSPLIEHAWSEKAKKMMLGVQTAEVGTVKRAKVKEPRKPVEEFIDSLYWISEKPEDRTEAGFDKAIAEGAKFGFPVTGIKQAMASAAYRRGWVENKMALRGGVFIKSNEDGLVEVKYNKPPEMREDMVRIGAMSSTADLRYRGEFTDWYIDLEIEYDTDLFTPSEIVNFLNAAGFTCGIGEWRPEKDGSYGMFRVAAN